MEEEKGDQKGSKAWLFPSRKMWVSKGRALVNLLPCGVLVAGLSPEIKWPLSLGPFVPGFVSCWIPREEYVSEIAVK